MTEENNKLEKPSNIVEMFKPKKWGIAAAKEQAKKAIADLDPSTMEHRLGIVFDDSGSMGSQVDDKSKIDHAHAGIRNFTAQCNPKDTSLAIYPLNKTPQALTCNYDVLNLYVGTIRESGGTPLYTITTKMLNEADLTRGVLFSDGSPTDGHAGYGEEYDKDLKEDMINLAIAKKVPLDTIFIGYDGERGYDLLKEIADRTGGIFVHFKDAKALGASLKYLAPALRGILMNAELKEKIQRGETI
jgi:hypothetical protein